MLDKIIAFIGPSMVGKTTISKELAYDLNEEKISTDTFCKLHTYHSDTPEETLELFDHLKEYIYKNNVRIVDIGSNTIEDCTDDELKYIENALTINGNSPDFYLLLPTKDIYESYTFLEKSAKRLSYNTPEVLRSIRESLKCESFKKLRPTTIYTLDDYKKPFFKSTTTSYQNHLKTIANFISQQYKVTEKQ